MLNGPSFKQEPYRAPLLLIFSFADTPHLPSWHLRAGGQLEEQSGLQISRQSFLLPNGFQRNNQTAASKPYSAICKPETFNPVLLGLHSYGAKTMRVVAGLWPMVSLGQYQRWRWLFVQQNWQQHMGSSMKGTWLVILADFVYGA